MASARRRHLASALSFTAASGRPVYFVGCGTSYHACLLGAYYWNQIAGRTAVALLAPQFIEQCGRSVGPDDVAVFVSQSGETKDVHNAVKTMRGRGGRVLGVLNVLGSTRAGLLLGATLQ